MTPTDSSSVGPVLRPAVVDDVRAMAEVYVAARQAGSMPDSVQSSAEVARVLAARLADDETWVAELEGHVVAYVRFVRPDAERVAWVDDLYVHPRAQRQGIGAALLDVVGSVLGESFGLWVFTQNHAARRFYAARGLVEVEETDGRDNPEGVPEVRMVFRRGRSRA